MIRLGDDAPDFTLLAEDGEPLCLYDVLAEHHAVLFFYAKDGTPG